MQKHKLLYVASLLVLLAQPAFGQERLSDPRAILLDQVTRRVNEQIAKLRRVMAGEPLAMAAYNTAVVAYNERPFLMPFVEGTSINEKWRDVSEALKKRTAAYQRYSSAVDLFVRDAHRYEKTRFVDFSEVSEIVNQMDRALGEAHEASCRAHVSLGEFECPGFYNIKRALQARY